MLYLGSFSKTFAPGYRVGWVVAPHAVREKLVLASESAILCPSNASQIAISTYLSTCDWRGQIKSYREQYRERRDAMISALDRAPPRGVVERPRRRLLHLGHACPTVSTPRTCCRAPSPPASPTCPGTAFYFDGSGADHMRLSFCYPTPERIREGVRRLAGVVAGERELVELFGTTGSVGHDDVQPPGPDVA